jgi:thiosulfate/3-mercaptopyruvate sulfurtransferase
MTAPLVTTAWLRDRLERPPAEPPAGERTPGERTPGEPPLRIVDCRWRLGQPGAGEALWREGHIPGAAFLDVDRDLSAAPGPGGRHPLPSADAFEAAARRAGIGRGSPVVAYDEAGEGGAARLWWLLRHFGHSSATVLDGGLRAWREEGGELHGGAEQITPGDFTAGPPEADTTTAEEVSRIATGDTPASEARTDEAEPGGPRAVLLDARAAERYRGEVEPIDPVAGHIPSAVSLPFAALAPDGRFLTPDELRARFDAAGVRPGDEVVAYCGSGVTAAVLVLAAEVAGVGPLRLYPGSWSEWSGRGGPVERG